MPYKLEIDPYYDFLLFVGRKNAGKTYFASQIIKHLKTKRIIIVDTNKDFSKIPELRKYCIYLDPTADALSEFIKKMRRINANGDYAISNILLIIDDIDMYGKPINNDDLRGLAYNGRHQGIGLIMIARRPVYFETLLMNTDYLFIGYGEDQVDYEYIYKHYRSFDISVIDKINADKDAYLFYMIDQTGENRIVKA